MHFPDAGIAAYPFATQEGTGGVSYPPFPVYNVAPTQVQPDRPVRKGQLIVDKFGNWYQIVRAQEALTIGQVVRMGSNATGTVVTADSTGDNKHVIRTNISGGGILANGEVGNYLVIVTAATTLAVKRIKGNTATSGSDTYITISKKDTRFARGDYDADAFASAQANGLVCHIVRGHEVKVCGAGEYPVGVAMGTVTSTNLTAVMVHGFCPQIAAVGDTDALADNGVMCTAASGAVKGTLGTATAASAVAERKGFVGIAKIANANAAGAFVAGYLDLFGRW